MFHKVHTRLAVVFTSACVFILIIMSGFYLYLNYRSIYINSFNNFNNDTMTLSYSFQTDKIFSHDWLKNIEANYNYSLFIYDNSMPIRFTTETKSTQECEFTDQLKTKIKNKIADMRYSSIVRCKTLQYSNDSKKYYVGVIVIPAEKGTTEVYIIDYLENEKDQIKELYIHFFIIIFICSTGLFLFSYLFTFKILQPVKKAHEQQTYFIAAASHEIRNPVNTILSATEAMDKCEEKERSEFSEIVRKEGKRLVYLTEDLLTLARSDNGKFPVNPAPTDLDTLIVDCYEAFTAPSNEKGIRISIQLPEEAIPQANIDAERIKQVISIVLSNAVSYTPQNGQINISYCKNNNSHIITISDNGSGISDDDKKHIFERFYRVDHSRENRSHFGLGLAIAKEIITTHKGEISVRDSKYGGAEFVISLPL